jgi:hypothetical protein
MQGRVMRRRLHAVTAVSVTIAALAIVSTTGAVIGGQPDNGQHPNVGVIVVVDDTGASVATCTATLVAPSTVLTAAHCFDSEFGRGTRAYVDFDQQLRFSTAGGYYVLDNSVTGTGQLDPLYDPSLTTNQGGIGTARFVANSAYDVALIHLDEPAAAVFPSIQPAPITGPGTNNIYKNGAKQLVLQVGYGYQRAGAPGQGSSYFIDYSRNQSQMPVSQLTDGLLYFHGNSNNAIGYGGSCSGDSGSPIFRGSEIIAIESFAGGTSQNVAGGPRLDAGPGRDFLRANGLVP